MHVFTAIVEIDSIPVSLLVAQHSVGQSIDSLMENLYSDHADQLQRADCIIVRPDVHEIYSAANFPSAQAGSRGESFGQAVGEAAKDPDVSFARAPDTPVLTLYTDGRQHFLGENLNPAAPHPIFGDQDPAQVIEAVRDRELQYLVERSRALLPPVPGSLYGVPSGRRTRSFVRVGSIQYSRQAIDAVCFWLLPPFRNCDAILADTWSISSVALNLASLIGQIRSTHALPVEVLSHYQDGSPVRQALAAESLDRLMAETDGAAGAVRIGCLVSATHSGSLVAEMNKLIAMSGFDVAMDYTAIFQLNPDLGVPALCDLSGTNAFRAVEDSEVTGKTIIAIDPQSYFPTAYVDIEIEIRQRHAAMARPFLEMVKGERIITVHRDNQDDGPPRHHAIHVDTAKLVELQAFREVFKTSILALDPPPAVIVTPNHTSALQLGALAVEILGDAGLIAVHHSHSNLSFAVSGPTQASDETLREALLDLSADQAILILDDAFITGTRLTAYQARLRSMGAAARIHYHVAVARPPDLAIWEQRKLMLSYRDPAQRVPHAKNSATATITLCLPNWPEHHCPWCLELAHLNHLLGKGVVLPEALDFRRNRLIVDKPIGLAEDAFLKRPEADSLVLGPGSVLAPSGSTEAEVLAAVASALQTLRTVEEDGHPRLGPRQYPLSTVLKKDEYLGHVYSETIIRAAVLRLADQDEQVYATPILESERSASIATICASGQADVNDLIPELIIAAALGRCELDQAARQAIATSEVDWSFFDVLANE